MKNITSLREDYNYKYIINEDYKQKVRLCVNSNEIKDELHNLKSNVSNGNMSADEMIIKLRQLCVKISDKTLTKIYFSKSNKKVNKKKHQLWFDDECMKLRQEVNTKRKNITKP